MIVPVHRRGSVRAPGPDDAAALVAMFERCRVESRYGRFLSPVAEFPPGHLHDVVHPGPGRWSWVTTGEDPSRIIAVASLFRAGTDTAELGLLVEDAAQRGGLGTELLGVVAAHAGDSGIDVLSATTLVQSHHVRRMLERLGRVTASTSGPTCDLRVELVDLAHRRRSDVAGSRHGGSRTGHRGHHVAGGNRACPRL
jgi:RimJ/RimL family protein N-acetyltransferase